MHLFLHATIVMFNIISKHGSAGDAIRVAIDFLFCVASLYPLKQEISGLSKKEDFSGWASLLSSYNHKYDRIYFLLVSLITEAGRDHSKCFPSDPHTLCRCLISHLSKAEAWRWEKRPAGKNRCRFFVATPPEKLCFYIFHILLSLRRFLLNNFYYGKENVHKPVFIV